MPAREYSKARQRTLTVTCRPFVPEIPQPNIDSWQMSQNPTYSQHIRGRAPQRSSPMKLRLIAAAAAALALTAMTIAQDNRPMSPRGTASAQVLGSWVKAERSFAVGGGKYEGGKWIDISYGRPLKRGREIFGSGADYGKATLIGAPIWRAGADVTTRLKTEVPLVVNSKTIAPGEYSLFVDLKEKNWTFVVSTWPAQEKYDPNNKQALWGSYDYTPDKDVVRAPMSFETLAHSREELTWEFLDMTPNGGSIAVSWDKSLGRVGFRAGS
jgi:hypothetical protein